MNPQSSNRINFQQSARFNFVWTVVWVIFIVVAVITVSSFFFDKQFFEYYLIGLFVISTALVLLWLKSKYYKIISIFLFIFIDGILSFSILTEYYDIHFQGIFWLLMIAIFSFFILDRKWGFLFLSWIPIIYTYYYNFQFQDIMQHGGFIKPESEWTWTFEYVISMLLLGCVMIYYSQFNQRTLQKVTLAFKELELQKRRAEQKSREKTLLLQEIHHRVKNNLQVIVSLLRIQMKDFEHEVARNAFNKAISRVISMALIHQKLYEKESFAEIDVKDYLLSLYQRLTLPKGISPIINHQFYFDKIALSGRDVVPLGLLFNELITHTMQLAEYGNEKEVGLVLIINNKNNKQLQMIYIDDFIAQEKYQDVIRFEQLIEVFSTQLNGSYTKTITAQKTQYQFTLNISLNAPSRV